MKKTLLAITLASIALNAKAVKVDEILTKSGKFKLDFSLAYTNIQSSNGVNTIQTFQTSNGDYVTIPTFLGNGKTNQDYLNYDLTLRYGFSSNLELFSSLNFYISDTNKELSGEFKSINSSGFNALNIGATYQIKKEDKYPSLIVGFSTSAIEKMEYNDKKYTSHFKNLRLFATSYYTVDPVVFLLNTSYNFSFKKSLGSTSYNGSDIFTISPQIYFAVNPYTSLNWGVKYTHKSSLKIDGKKVSNSQSEVAFLFGTSYEINDSTILSINAEYSKTNEGTKSSIATNITYKF